MAEAKEKETNKSAVKPAAKAVATRAAAEARRSAV